MTEGYRLIMGSVRDSFDSYDLWASIQGWRFAIADVLWREYDAVPDEWEYRHGACDGERDSFPDSELWEQVGSFDAEDLIDVGNVLARYADVLRAAGKDY